MDLKEEKRSDGNSNIEHGMIVDHARNINRKPSSKMRITEDEKALIRSLQENLQVHFPFSYEGRKAQYPGTKIY